MAQFWHPTGCLVLDDEEVRSGTWPREDLVLTHCPVTGTIMQRIKPFHRGWSRWRENLAWGCGPLAGWGRCRSVAGVAAGLAGVAAGWARAARDAGHSVGRESPRLSLAPGPDLEGRLLLR
jgi:hypothetical protein